MDHWPAVSREKWDEGDEEGTVSAWPSSVTVRRPERVTVRAVMFWVVTVAVPLPVWRAVRSARSQWRARPPIRTQAAAG